jgi:hypothetical protein
MAAILTLTVDADAGTVNFKGEMDGVSRDITVPVESAPGQAFIEACTALTFIGLIAARAEELSDAD